MRTENAGLLYIMHSITCILSLSFWMICIMAKLLVTVQVICNIDRETPQWQSYILLPSIGFLPLVHTISQWIFHIHFALVLCEFRCLPLKHFCIDLAVAYSHFPGGKINHINSLHKHSSCRKNQSLATTRLLEDYSNFQVFIHSTFLSVVA